MEPPLHSEAAIERITGQDIYKSKYGTSAGEFTWLHFLALVIWFVTATTMLSMGSVTRSTMLLPSGAQRPLQQASV